MVREMFTKYTVVVIRPEISSDRLALCKWWPSDRAVEQRE